MSSYFFLKRSNILSYSIFFQAQEDAEALRAIVMPLEEVIFACSNFF